MMKTIHGIVLYFIVTASAFLQAQDTSKTKAPERTALKYNLNADGSHYWQITFLNQTWVRYNESNPGTTQFNKVAAETYDIGLRRTRMQLFGQITDRAFLYFQFGQNNFNSAYNYSTGTNRKIAAFFHDAVCEFRVSKGNQLKIGSGLTVLNALSRFSQPSIASILTLDVPVFLQYTVDQTDQFDRRLAIYARGQVSHLDYRAYLSNPFPVNTNGAAAPALSTSASFINPSAFKNGSGPGIHNQFGSYLAWNFFENETHTTPYMQGTYLGTKKIFNVAIGTVYQKAATWHLVTDNTGTVRDTAFNNMFHFSLESFLDMPLSKEKGTAISAFAGYYNMNYGHDYLRYNGIMNPGTSSIANNQAGANSYGNAYPMFGSGQVLYAQLGYLLPKKTLGEKNGQVQPYASAQLAKYKALQQNNMLVFDAGFNWLLAGHRSKISVDYQNRPTYYKELNTIRSGPRRGSLILQYQIFI